MNFGVFRLCVLLLASSLGLSDVEVAPSGKQLYHNFCAACHDGADPKAPSLNLLESMNSRFVFDALSKGKMRQQGKYLSRQEKDVLVRWLGRNSVAFDEWEDRVMCDDRSVNTSADIYTSAWGLDDHNTRFQSRTTLNAGNTGELKKKWVMAFPGVSTMRSQPAVIGDTIYIAVAELYKVYALDRHTGCLKWVYKADDAPRSAISAGHLSDGRAVIFYGDMAGYAHMLDARTAEPIWVKKVAAASVNIITGPLTLFDGKLFVPQSSVETLAAADPDYECCSTRGALTAHNALTGELVWTAFPIEKATLQGKNRIGVNRYGPAGASIWNAPLIDRKRGLIIVGTGPLSSGPDNGGSDAIIAFDIKTGFKKWHFQGLKNDFWNSACRTHYDDGSHPNCPDMGWDFDFGAAVILTRMSNGQEILIAGQKSGQVYGLDPDNGQLLWEQRLSEGSVLGGVHWGMAVDDGHIYVPINDPSLRTKDIKMNAAMLKRLENYHPRSGLYKLDVDSGEVVWARRQARNCQPDYSSKEIWPVCPKEIGLSAAPIAINGAIIVAGLDGAVHIYATQNGDLLFRDQTAIDFSNTVNAIPGHGGSIDNASMMVAGSMLFVQSGYSFTGMPGNVLIAYGL